MQILYTEAEVNVTKSYILEHLCLLCLVLWKTWYIVYNDYYYDKKQEKSQNV